MQRPSDRGDGQRRALVMVNAATLLYLRTSASICVHLRSGLLGLYSRPFVSIRALDLPHTNTGREPPDLFLGQFRGFEFTFLHRKRTAWVETAASGWI